MNEGPSERPSIWEIFLSFLRLGATAFGGPAMVAYIRALAVTRRQWLDDADFKNGVALCQSVPGATAMQMAAYVGLRARGTPGALAAFTGFGLPAFVLILLLSVLYARYNSLPQLAALFSGLQVIVIAIVLHAAISFGRNIATSYKRIIIALCAGVLFRLGINPFLIVIGAAILGMAILRLPVPDAPALTGKKEASSNAKALAALLALVISCLAAIGFINPSLFSLAAVMLKIDLFAFGGGFVSLPLMLQEVVVNRQWMDTNTFMDGIALGQVTPGPIVITAAFVGYLVYGFPGAIVATVSIFTPSFFLVVAVTPFFDRLKRSAYFRRATEGIYASFVGLLFLVCFNFAVVVPWDTIRFLLCIAAFAALWRKVDIFYIVPVGAVISILVF